MSNQKIQDLKTQGYTIIQIDFPTATFQLRKPTKHELLLYQDDTIKNKESVSSRSEKFVRQLFVGENIEEFNQYLNDKPLSIGIILEELLKGLGGDENFTVTEL